MITITDEMVKQAANAYDDVYMQERGGGVTRGHHKAIRAALTAALGDAEPQLAALFERVTDLSNQVQRLRAFGEEMSWYAPDEDWEDAARRLLKYGDVRPIAEYRAAVANAKGGDA